MAPASAVPGVRMTGSSGPGPAARGTRLVIAGVVLAITGAFSLTALVVQLAVYEPSCEPLAAPSFGGACGVLRLLVLLTLPVLLAGLGLLAAGWVLRRRARPGAGG